MPLLKHNSVTVTLLTVLLSACSTPSGLSDNKAKNSLKENMPAQWQAQAPQANPLSAVSDNWIKSFGDQALEHMIAHALTHNFQLNAERYNVQLAKARLKVSMTTDFPELSLSLDNARRKQVLDTTTSYQTSADVSIDLRYELDLWGKLSDQQNQDRLNYAAAQANFKESFWKTQLLDYKPFETWSDEGSKDTMQLAHERVERMMTEYTQPPIDPAVDEALQAFIAQRKASEPDAFV